MSQRNFAIDISCFHFPGLSEISQPSCTLPSGCSRLAHQNVCTLYCFAPFPLQISALNNKSHFCGAGQNSVLSCAARPALMISDSFLYDKWLLILTSDWSVNEFGLIKSFRQRSVAVVCTVTLDASQNRYFRLQASVKPASLVVRASPPPPKPPISSVLYLSSPFSSVKGSLWCLL